MSTTTTRMVLITDLRESTDLRVRAIAHFDDAIRFEDGLGAHVLAARSRRARAEIVAG
jgi:hypothetical protein